MFGDIAFAEEARNECLHISTRLFFTVSPVAGCIAGDDA